MDVFCTKRFFKEYNNFLSNKSYRSVNDLLYNYLFDKNVSDVLSGTKLNGSCPIPYVKKRLGGRGGFRLYYIVVPDKEKVYLLYIHPKSGSLGADNINDETKALLYKEGLECTNNNDLLTIQFDSINNILSFEIKS